ncbi:hypothetical protein C2E23DRAFT_741108 [Lenzites betulinus]|nr:hypothetical protein C2E23DRAFT_741108 [Lenzites betulinus]
MGRSARYHTSSSKKAAHRDAVRRYELSVLGKQTRSSRNRRDYESRKDRTCTLLDIRLPDELMRQAKLLRPASFIFTSDNNALQLGLWTSPYHITPLNTDVLELSQKASLGPWNCLEAWLGAVVYDKIIELGWERKWVWMEPDLNMDQTEAQLAQEIRLRSAAWEVVWDSICEGTERAVRDIYLVWGARIVVMLANEWSIRKKGVEEYTDATEQGRLPWQMMIKEMSAMVARSG